MGGVSRRWRRRIKGHRSGKQMQRPLQLKTTTTLAHAMQGHPLEVTTMTMARCTVDFRSGIPGGTGTKDRKVRDNQRPMVPARDRRTRTTKITSTMIATAEAIAMATKEQSTQRQGALEPPGLRRRQPPPLPSPRAVRAAAVVPGAEGVGRGEVQRCKASFRLGVQLRLVGMPLLSWHSAVSLAGRRRPRLELGRNETQLFLGRRAVMRRIAAWQCVMHAPK